MRIARFTALRPRPASTACAISVALAFPLLAADAIAQSFTGTGPVRAFVLPGRDAAQPAPTAEAETVAPATPPARPERRLHHLPAHVDGLTLSGERAERSWIVRLTAGEASDPAAMLQVAYEAAASVSPESSRLRVSVNGLEIGTAPIRPPGPGRLARLPVPAGLLVRGANLVRIAAEQRHRVDCSPAATFELWTEIRPRATGLVTSAVPSAAVGDILDLGAVLPGPDGTTAIDVRLGGQRLTERGSERAIEAAQLAALLGRFAHAVVTFDALAADQGGLALAIGPVAALGASADLAGLDPVTGPRLALLTPADRRPTLVVTGRDDGEVDAALAILAEATRQATPIGAEAALRALAAEVGRPVEGGERLALAELGVPETAFAGRAFRLAFDIRLPHDVLAADYGRMTVDLAGGYAGGLDPGAQLRVEVNGGEAASLPLGHPSGERFSHQEILLPLSRLRPGRNSVAVTAALPDASDRACVEASGRERTRFTLSDKTEIVVPALARVARAPELSHLAAGAFPYAGSAARPVLQVPVPDRDSMSAAATLAVRLATAAGHAIPFAFTSGRPSGEGPVLIVAPARSLDPALLDRIGVGPQALQAAWQDREAAGPDARRGTAACRAEIRRRPPPAAPKTDPGLVWTGLDRIRGLVGAGTADATAQEDLAAASLFVAQGSLGQGDAEVPVTVVSAPNAGALREGVACLTGQRVWERLAGRLSLLDPASGEIRSVAAPHPAYLETQPRSVGNLRRIAAGWLSLNPGLYAAAALFVAACLATSTHWLVGHVGRRSE